MLDDFGYVLDRIDGKFGLRSNLLTACGVEPLQRKGVDQQLLLMIWLFCLRSSNFEG
jgi:hypothetical protein